MNYFSFIIKSAIADLLRNKVRTLLTSLGILIGVASVVLLIAFGLGLKAYIKQQFESLGANVMYIFPGQVLNRSGGFSGGAGAVSGPKFDERDVINIKKIPEVKQVVGAFTRPVSVTAGQKTESTTLYGTSQEHFPLRNLSTQFGQFFTKNDVEKRAKVVVVGPKIAKKLFETEENAVGKTVKIENLGYRIIGVLTSKGGGFGGGPDTDSFIYMPFKTAYVLNPGKKFLSILIQAESENSIAVAKEKINQTMLKRYKEDDFSVVEQTEILNTVTSIFSMLNSVLIAIGAVSLIVGGVGIMNIMYVSVSERTKEIGVRRAIGATKKDILLQFLSESVVLSIIGGVLGLGFSFLVVLIVRNFFPAYIDGTSIAISLGVSSVVGILFGVFPAKKAADLSPIEAIRYE